jgi:rubrerythrin
MMRAFANVLDSTVRIPSAGDMSSEDSEMDESSDDQSGTEMDADQAQWLMDIDDLIGETRIREIDQSLKKIPSIVTGNKIQTENVELKLIINHLLKKLNAQSVVDTIKIENVESNIENVESNIENVEKKAENFPITMNEEDNDDDDDAAGHFDDAAIDNDHSDNENTEDNEQKVEKTETYEKPVITEEPQIVQEIEIPETTLPEVIEEKVSFQEVIEEVTLPEVIEEEVPNVNMDIVISEVNEDVIMSEVEGNVQVPEVNEYFELPEIHEKIKAIEVVPMKLKKETQKQTRATRKRKNETLPHATSSAKKMKPEPTYDLLKIDLEQPSTSAQADKSVNAISQSKKRGRPRVKAEVETKVVIENKWKLGGVLRSRKNSPEKARSPSPLRLPSPPPPVIQEEEQPRLRRRYSKLVSESDVVSESSLCKPELISNDLNSVESAVIYHDYLNAPCSPSLDQKHTRELTIDVSTIALVKEAVSKQKTADPTFRAPEQGEKRPYLRTSAFTGNHDDNDNKSADSDSSSDTSGDSKGEQSNLSLKELMNSLIEGKETIVDKNRKPAKKKVKKKEKPKKETTKKFLRDMIHISKKVYEQEPLEPAVEAEVPYDELVESIRVSNPPRGNKSGKALWVGKKFDENEAKSWRDKLKKQEYFRCGCCKFLVTKHKWRQHLESHGVFAYIEDFETPLNISDWNESLRRIIQYSKIHKIETLKCPNCDSVKRSPLGQMSHIYVCGETQETLESRKILCEFCDNRILPYMMSMHKKTCPGLLKLEELDRKGNSESEEETVYNTSGRAKRKAVQKYGVKKYFLILNKLFLIFMIFFLIAGRKRNSRRFYLN